MEEKHRNRSNVNKVTDRRADEAQEYVDDDEMEEIRNNKHLNKSLKRGYQDVKLKKGRFIGGLSK